MENSHNRRSPLGKIGLGLILLSFGGLLLSRNLGLYIPQWLTSWPLLLIAIGLISGIRHEFKRPGAFILILVGVVFLTDKLIPGFEMHELLFPLLITGAGIYLIINRNRNHRFCSNNLHRCEGKFSKWNDRS